MQLDKKRVADVFERLKSVEFDVFRDFLKHSISEKRGSLECASDMVQVYRLQGELAAMRELLAKVTRGVVERQ